MNNQMDIGNPTRTRAILEKYGLSDYLSIKQKYFDNYQKSLSE